MALQVELNAGDPGATRFHSINVTAWRTLLEGIESGIALMGPPPHAQSSNILVVNEGGKLSKNRSAPSGYRLDRQNAARGYANLSVQINGEGAPSTIASVMLASLYYQQVVRAPQKVGDYRNQELANAIRKGLEKSLRSRFQDGKAYKLYRSVITGQYSN